MGKRRMASTSAKRKKYEKKIEQEQWWHWIIRSSDVKLNCICYSIMWIRRLICERWFYFKGRFFSKFSNAILHVWLLYVYTIFVYFWKSRGYISFWNSNSLFHLLWNLKKFEYFGFSSCWFRKIKWW